MSCTSALQVVLAISLLVWSSRANTVDTCAYLDNFDLSAALNSELSITSIPDLDGKLNRCLCVSGISDFINQNTLATQAVSTTSMSRVVEAIAEMIESTSSHESCTYPDNSQASCTQNNVCGYTVYISPTTFCYFC
ncbi:hypothetical protein PILCRDRAFT_814020 [Piloderma croceum F 1598]|uniref:Uncharacterized protein n=1 Tax=Piloderma croceum (strain F 1598) TaxID=765440 RepID=A0A0C3CEI2_PILCF|nr:hypothetical protein PILCRDRAFT_814020 [Piloderma croceum F 1598]